MKVVHSSIPIKSGSCNPIQESSTLLPVPNLVKVHEKRKRTYIDGDSTLFTYV